MSTDNQPLDVVGVLGERRKAISTALRAGALPEGFSSFLRGSVHILSTSPGGTCTLALGNDDASPADIHVDEQKMSVTLPISTVARDRMRDVVMPKGCLPHLKNYERNPRVFFSHRSTDHPIGSARNPSDGSLALAVTDDKITSTCYFHGETSESEVVFRLVKRKELQAASIGFLPVVASLIKRKKGASGDDDDVRKTPDGERIFEFEPFMPLRFLEWDLTEWSIVPVPANPEACEALTLHLERGHVEGERLPATIRRSLEPFKLKARVWLPGFNPDVAKFSGTLALGDSELEYAAGRLVRLDDHALVKQDDANATNATNESATDNGLSAPDSLLDANKPTVILHTDHSDDATETRTVAIPTDADLLEAVIERAVRRTMSALDDTAGGTTVSANPDASNDKKDDASHKLLQEIHGCLQEFCAMNAKAHEEILACLRRLEGAKEDSLRAQAQASQRQIADYVASVAATNAKINQRLDRLVGSGGRR